jgi:hypothetical protein
MSTTEKKAGRPRGSGVGNYTKNPNQKRPGRGKLILTESEIEERKERKRKRVLKCYYQNREIELDLRAKKKQRIIRIKKLLDLLKLQLETQGEFLDDTDEEILNKLKTMI